MRWIAFNTELLSRTITDTPPRSGRSTLHGGTGGAACWLHGNAWRFQSRWWRWGSMEYTKTVSWTMRQLTRNSCWFVPRDKTGKNKLRYPDFMTFWMLSEKKKNRCAADSGSSSYSVFRTAKQILPMQRQSRHFLPRITASVLQMGTVTVPQSPKPLPVHSYHLAAQGKPQSRPARQAVIVNLTSALCNHLRWIYRERLFVSKQRIV